MNAVQLERHAPAQHTLPSTNYRSGATFDVTVAPSSSGVKRSKRARNLTRHLLATGVSHGLSRSNSNRHNRHKQGNVRLGSPVHFSSYLAASEFLVTWLLQVVDANQHFIQDVTKEKRASGKTSVIEHRKDCSVKKTC
jgi:hypothetical protein